MIIVWFLINRALRKKENANSKNKKGHMKRSKKVILSKKKKRKTGIVEKVNKYLETKNILKVCVCACVHA